MTDPLSSETLDDVFRHLEADEIRRWIAERRLEDLTLEFKTAPQHLEHREERRMLAEAISGFSNSSGGLLVWGVEARKDVTGVDGASEQRVLTDPPRMLANLLRHSGTAVAPTAAGVVHRLVASGEFAVTLVPESDSPPHMAKFGHDRYFKRSGDSFYRMEHFDLADMFGRRRQPRLELFLTRIDGTNYLRIALRNTSRVSARAPFVAIAVAPPFAIGSGGVDGNGTYPLPRLTENKYESDFGGHALLVIHPHQTVDVARIHCESANPPAGDYRLAFEVAMEDVALTHFEMILRCSGRGPEFVIVESESERQSDPQPRRR